MNKIIYFLKFAYKNKQKWLVPVVVILLIFILVNHYLADGGFSPLGYKIF